jgi:4,5-DOPA dioxygenase extradiol
VSSVGCAEEGRAVITRRTALAFGATALATRTLFADDARLVPACYVAHGSPMLAVDTKRGAELRAWAASMPKPTGVVALTPHWRARGVRIGHVGRGRALYSFPDFMRSKLPPNLDYASPDNTELARVVSDLLAPLEPSYDESRAGFDHTTWMPLMHMLPNADVPVVEIALPFAHDKDLFSLGKRLALLRLHGVMILASGNATHNLAAMAFDAPPTAKPAPWAEAFAAWIQKTLDARDVESMLDWRARAPNADLAHPDDGGHFRVMLVALGAVARGDSFSSARFPIAGFEGLAQSNLCVELA